MTTVFYSPTDQLHHPKTLFIKGVASPNKEIPERAIHLLNAVKSAGLDVKSARDFGLDPIARIHTQRYLKFLREGYEGWSALDGASLEIVPNAFPLGDNICYPDSIVGRAGFHMADMACPINGATWTAAYGSAQSALSASYELVQGITQHSYGLCRPPGHHAFADRASGYCFINNAAVAAQFLRDSGFRRVTILDVDVHHGNGTQEIFYKRGDVQTVSIHCHPANYYPFFWGYPEQIGTGEGANKNHNFTLGFGVDDDAYMSVLASAITIIKEFEPEALVVSLGLDTFRGDPYAALNLSSECYKRIGKAISDLAIPTVSLQEGGYICPELGSNLVNYLLAFSNT